MKSAQLIKKSLRGKNVKAYEQLEQDCNTEEVTVTAEELEALLGSVAEPFDSIGMELEKHMYTARTLYLNEEVCAETVNHIVMLIHKWNYEDCGVPVEDRQNIVLYIDTPGGELMKAGTLVSAIENSVTPIVGYAEGIVMSAGLWIFLATHYRIATRHADFMYHELRASNGDMSTLREIHNTTNYYERLQNKIDQYIIENTEITQELLDEKKKSNLDWFIDASELETLGIVDELL